MAEARSEIVSIYPELALQKVPYPFVLPSKQPVDITVISQALDLYPTLTGLDAQELEGHLNQIGVYRIPRTSAFTPSIHELTSSGLSVPPLEYVYDGWMSSSRVYCKSVVSSA